MEQTINLPPQRRLARIQPQSVNTEQRSVELTWSTGAAVRRMDWWTGSMYNEELSLEPGAVRLERIDGGGANLIDSHDSFSLAGILGIFEKAWIENNEGRARVRFSERAEVEPIWQDVRGGIIRNVSVGYIVHRYETIKEADEKIETWRATDWEPVEISLVAVPADSGAQVRQSTRVTACTIVSPNRIIEVPSSRAASGPLRVELAEEIKTEVPEPAVLERSDAGEQSQDGASPAAVAPPDYRATLLRARLALINAPARLAG